MDDSALTPSEFLPPAWWSANADLYAKPYMTSDSGRSRKAPSRMRGSHAATVHLVVGIIHFGQMFPFCLQ